MALTKCSECGKEVSNKAKSCPNCGAPLNSKEKKKGSLLKKVIGVFIAIVGVLILIGSCSSGDDVKNVTPENTDSENTKDIDTNSNKTTAFSVGEIAEYRDVQVSVLDYEESTGNEWGKPEDGNVFVFINIEIANNSDEEINISSLVSFDGYCDDYKLDFSSNAFMAMTTNNMNQLDGSVATGKKMNGYLCIEVPSDWEVIEVYYKDNVWLGSNFKFVITK